MADSCIWYADHDGLRQVRSGTNEVAATVALQPPRLLAMNGTDCGVWALGRGDRRLLRFSADGARELELDLRSIDAEIDEVRQLYVDPYDGSLWIVAEKRVYRVSASGALLAAFPSGDDVRGLRVAPDETLWLLTKKALKHLDANGALLSSYSLAARSGEARRLEIDAIGGVIWIAGEDEIVQLPMSDPGAAPSVRVRIGDEARGLALDPLSGALWVARKSAVVSYSRSGAPGVAIDLGGLDIGEADLAFDPASRSLWLETKRAVVRFGDAGERLATFAAHEGDKALAVPAFLVRPTLTLVRPPADALTNNPTPQFTLAFGAKCNAEDCPFAGDYFGTYVVDASLNGQAVGAQFAFAVAAAQASFTPAARLPEGLNRFSAQVKDRFGHVSEPVVSAFTVDTLAPKFVTLTPITGSVFSSPSVLIQGATDDASSTVALAGAGFGQSGASFSFPVVLQPGPNVFNISATDRAGNATSATLQLFLTTISLSIDSPANGAAIASDSVIVSGTLQAPANTGVTVNGSPAIVTGGRFIAANVPLQQGANVLTVIATTPDGQTATRTISVNGGVPEPMRVIASVSQGVAPLTVTFSIDNRTPNIVFSAFADFGSGHFVAFGADGTVSETYAVPGTFQERFIINSTKQFTPTVTVVVQARAELDQTLRAVWDGFATALASGDTAQAIQYFNAQGKTKYGPVFDALRPQLPAIVASFSPLQSMTLSADIGEYAINRTIDAVNRIFLVYFLRDLDGVWRLDSM